MAGERRGRRVTVKIAGRGSWEVELDQRDDLLALVRKVAKSGAGARPAPAEGQLLVTGSCSGRPLGLHDALVPRGVCGGDLVEVRATLCGGGGDGGSTGAEDRKAWLEMFLEKKPDKVDPAELKLAKWSRCQLSGQLLSEPCVADGLGNLYNKQAVVECLLNKAMPEAYSHISGLRDVREVRLCRNPAFSRERAGESAAGGAGSQFQCPVTGLEMSGRSRFYAVRATGHVVSERALREAAEAVEDLCGIPAKSLRWKPGGGDLVDLLPVNGTAEQVEVLREQVRRKAAARKDKKGKKKRKLGAAEEAGAAAGLPKTKRAAPAVAPAGADKAVYASIFTSSSKGEVKETFMCRSNAARGMNLT